MASPDQQPIDFQAIPDSDQLERECVAALRSVVTDPASQTAARVAAAKQLLEWLSGTTGTGDLGNQQTDPGALTLDQINAELNRLA